jgi:cytidylate kinase
LGRGGNFILPDNMAFKVRLIENLDNRLKNLARFDAPAKWTGKSLKKDDQQRNDYIHRFFGEKIDDPHHYDLVINLAKTGIKTAEEIIINGLSAKFNLSERDLRIPD